MLRSLPSIDKLLAHRAWTAAPQLPHAVRRSACRGVVGDLRSRLLAGELLSPSLDEIATDALRRALADVRPVLQRVVNATGVLLHTNLGRAPLPEAALTAIGAVAGAYTNLELDLDSGKRDSRHDRLGAAFARILGCGDVVVLNNNAAAVYLALSSLSSGGEAPVVAISRGEQVEIGGSFRMPDIMAASGAKMVEIGTTNRTHLDDYAAAIDAGAQVVIKVARSNFALSGFTAEVEIPELAALCQREGVLLLHDLGSGLLHADLGLGRDCVRRSLDAGVDLVLFSGDKLLGGPQCGVAAGKRQLVDALRAVPILRMLRPGKLTLLALEATLLAWERDPSGGEIPLARMLSAPLERIEKRAEALAGAICALLSTRAAVSVIPVQGRAGGGTLPGRELPSFAVCIAPADGGDSRLAASLRQGQPSVLARIDGGRVLLDVRTILEGDEQRILAALVRWEPQGV